jgi:hypothetical protein
MHVHGTFEDNTVRLRVRILATSYEYRQARQILTLGHAVNYPNRSKV